MKLKKRLGLIHVFCIATGAMVSSGIFVLPGLAHAQAGPAVIVSYLIAGLLAGTGMLSVAELATAMPRAGGDYFYIARTMGPAVGTVAGLLTWFSLSLKSALALVGMAAFARLVINEAMPDVMMQTIGAGLCLVFVVLNLVGAKEAATLQVYLVMALLVAMGIYIVFGLAAVNPSNLDPVAPHGLPPVLFTAGFVFVAYGGLLKVSSIAEEVRNPGRTVPMGMIISLVIVVCFYTLMVLVTTGVMPHEELNKSLTPISDGARRFMGTWGGRLMGAAALMAFITTANAGIMAASRYLLALGRDQLAPAALGNVNERFQTPHAAILTTGAFVAASLFLNLGILVEAASTVLILSYALSSLCVIVLRESHVQNYRPRFRAPFYPWLQVIGILGFGLLIFEMGTEAFLISALLVVAGFVAYWFYGRATDSRDYALLHLLKRITARKLVTGDLDRELKQIIRERDEIKTDRFDELIEHCPVLDLDGPHDRDALFQAAAAGLAGPTGLTSEDLVKHLADREAEGSTVLSPFLAIPHLVLDSDLPFSLLLARSREGIRFSDEAPEVHAVVVLAGSRSERNFHLRCLAAVAQIVRGPEFEKRWLGAPDEQGLRDIFLLADRRREH